MSLGNLQKIILREGVSRLLHFGPKQTKKVAFRLDFEAEHSRDTLEVELSHGAPDSLYISEEKLISQTGSDDVPVIIDFGASPDETKFHQNLRPVCRSVTQFLSGIRFYQFHDTSETSELRRRVYIDDAVALREDGGNLAPFLFRMKDTVSTRKYYDRIVRHIRRMMPHFGDFSFLPIPGDEEYRRLNWTDDSGSDYFFDPGQISDGSLRFMALAALLLQPPERLPDFIVLDEPELGLHPSAIAELSGMIRIAAQSTQILLATQSTRLVDEFSPEELVIAEWDKVHRRSVFSVLDPEQLDEWLERYSLSELWEKNVLGGRP